jgi:molybdopterin converting factor small subunit
MHITVHYFGQMKRAVGGHSTDQVELPDGSALGDLFANLVARYGSSVRGLLLTERGDLRAEAGVQLNGRNAVALQGLSTPLKEDDQAVIVLLAPPVMGG